MASQYAFVTLLTSDHYLPGALTLAAALRDVHPSPAVSPELEFQTVCLVTPETVDVSTIKLLRKAFDIVIGVELIAQDDEEGLKLLGVYLFRYPSRARVSIDLKKDSLSRGIFSEVLERVPVHLTIPYRCRWSRLP